jgi:tripeptide aminopeptidase
MYEINSERLIQSFIELTQIPSPSWDERGVINYISKKLKKLHIGFERYQCGKSFNILARLDNAASKKPILFSCHMDTVVPCDSVKPIITEKKISSDGTTILGADDKAAIATFLEAIHFIKENNIAHGPIEFLFSCAEEVGLYGMKGFDVSKLKAVYAFVFDSDGGIGRIIVEAPYHITIEISIRGKTAHAGIEPEKGISAIKVLAEIVSKIPHGRIDSETTVNTGLISGGEATNIVAEQAYAKLEVRSISLKKLKRIESEIKAIIKNETKRYGAKVTIEKYLEYSGFSIGHDHKIVEIAREAIERLRIKPVIAGSGGGSDTNILNRAGIKAVNLSIGIKKPHTKNEYILTRDLVNGTRLVLSIIESI